MSTAVLDVETDSADARKAITASPVCVLRPMAIEWLAACASLMALVALALVRVGMTDTPYHLATARVAHETGHWPTTNAFSYTFPDYPLYQQYPVYQELLYRIYNAWYWEGLSILHLAAQAILFGLWIAWAGGWRIGVVLALPTMILLLGLRERMVLRPDILSMAYFASTLLILDQVRRGRIWMGLALLLIALLWVNSHQMFWLGLVLQSAFLFHLFLARHWGGRFGISKDDAGIPISPVAIALGASIVACLFSPLGARIVEVPLQTVGSLSFHRGDVDEFAPFYTSGQATRLVLVASMFAAIAFWLARARWQTFEMLVLLLTGLMALGAIRGVPYYVAVSVGILGREISREWMQRGVAIPRFLRVAGAILALTLAAQVLWHRWVDPSRTLGGSQFGVGRVLGAWPDATMKFLQDHPPPGNPLNLGWYIGNPMVLDLYPRTRVFVDPRFEAYPREFLVRAISAERDPITLDALLDQFEPLWIIAEIRKPSIRHQVARLLSMKEWEAVFLDPVCVVLVRKTPETTRYLADNAVRLELLNPPGFLVDEADLLALQQLRLAAFFADLGKLDRARHWIDQAKPNLQMTYAVRRAYASLLKDHPDLQE